MKYEDALEKVEGNGRFHIFLLLALSTTAFMSSLDMNSMIFFGYVPKFNCVDTQNGSEVTWDKSNQCQGYQIRENGKNETVKCRKWKYDTNVMKRTIVTEFDLICDRSYLKTITETIYYVGLAFGNLLGIFGDRFGRRHMILIPCAFEVLIILAVSFIPYLWLITTLRFLWGLTTFKMFHGISIMMEILSIKKRSFYGNNYWMFWALGYMIIPGIAYLIKDWRHIRLISCIPYIFYVFLYFVPESPRWLSINGRHQEAKENLIYIAKWNGVNLLKTDFDELEVEESRGKLNKLYLYKEMRRKMLVCLFIQGTFCLSYFGLSINSELVTEDIFLNVLIQGSLEFPTGLLGWISSSKLNRKSSMLIFCIFTSCSLLVSGFLNFGKGNMFLIFKSLFGSIGKFFLTTTFCIIDMYISEIFPTEIRNLAIFIIFSFGSFCSILAPTINTLSQVGSLTLYSVLCVTCAFLIWFTLPETKGCPLAQTIEEGEQLRRGNEKEFAKLYNKEINIQSS